MAINATNPDGPDAAGLLLTVKNLSTGQVIFRSDATAGPIIGASAGSAELQNITSTRPIESYYSYYPWGGLYQQKSRLDVLPSQSSGGPLAIDGSGIAGCSNATHSCSATLTTSKPNDIIIVYTAEMLNYP